jgi:hypothetical protein
MCFVAELVSFLSRCTLPVYIPKKEGGLVPHALGLLGSSLAFSALLEGLAAGVLVAGSAAAGAGVVAAGVGTAASGAGAAASPHAAAAEAACTVARKRIAQFTTH